MNSNPTDQRSKDVAMVVEAKSLGNLFGRSWNEYERGEGSNTGGCGKCGKMTIVLSAEESQEPEKEQKAKKEEVASVVGFAHGVLQYVGGDLVGMRGKSKRNYIAFVFGR